MKLLCLWLSFVSFAFVLSANGQSAINTLTANPNPFETTTQIGFDLATVDTVDLEIISALGQVLASIFENTALPSGSYQINYNGSALPDGVYVLRLSLTGNTFAQRLVKQSGSTSIDQADFTNTFLFPNPTDGLLYIPTKGNKTIVVCDATGRVLETTYTDANTYNLTLFHQGVYIVKVYDSENSLLSTQRIFKTN